MTSTTTTTRARWSLLVPSLTAYVAAIVLANVMTANLDQVPIGFGLLVTAGTFAAGFALLARDLVQQYGGVTLSLGAVGLGAFISWHYAPPGIVVASVVAFAAAEVVDLIIYTPTRARAGIIAAIIASNIIAAPVDTVLFLHLAGFPLTFDAVLGQFIGKVIFATLVPVLLIVTAHALLRKPDRA